MQIVAPECRIGDHLAFLYGAERASALFERLRDILDAFRMRNPELRTLAERRARERLTERDVLLITYGDQVTEPVRPPLQTLAEVLESCAKGSITGVHILPFFPYSSDDGFSVIDYSVVNPDLGTWADVERLGRSFRLMVDAVINHVSVQSDWFKRFLAGDPDYADYFITVGEDTDLSQVVRPRALPLLTRVQTAEGEKQVWTTFSSDQVDLNYANPNVLLRVIELLLWYVERGADVIRLDAIAYLWKRIGTPCIHLSETHRIVKLLRAILDIVAPHVIIITETNVPHEENISYFGDGTDEAQMVYQFTLPPLVLHAFHTGDAARLSGWAAGLRSPSDQATFFNFLASHDGIGVRPAEGILSSSEIQGLVDHTLAHGGYVSHRSNADGTESVYELNISYFDALSDPRGGEPLDVQVQRFLASQAILLSLVGVPGIYFHSLFGSRSYHEGVEQTGRLRSINREKLLRSQLESALADRSSLRYKVFYPYLHLIRQRVHHSAFHPNGSQRVVNLNPALFCVLRTSPDGRESVLCIHNVSDEDRPVRVGPDVLSFSGRAQVRDLVSGRVFPRGVTGDLVLLVAPYQVLWLTRGTDSSAEQLC